MKTRTWIGIGLLALLAGCKPAPKLDGIVLVIADGTSQELITATRDLTLGANGRLHLESLPKSAIVRTFSASDLVTDSSAAATAMARGIKADNRVVGMASSEATSSPASILDLAKKAGWSTAVITDDSVTGGTSSPFLIEHANRDQHEIIALKLLDQLGTRADLVLGGGSQWFFDEASRPDVLYKGQQRSAVRQTEASLSEHSVQIFTDWEKFATLPKLGGPPVLGVFYPDVFPFYADGTRTLRLKDMVAKAVELLQKENRPFLLVIEAALPDKASHLNQAKRAIAEVGEFDATIGWLREHVGSNVLLLATTDHSTGGFAFNGPPSPHRLKGEMLLGSDPVTGNSYFTWASGPGADRSALTRTRLIQEPGQPIRSEDVAIQPTDVDFTQPALIERKSAAHTAGDVWLLADGPGSEAVSGFLDNTEIYRIMARAIDSPGK